eukprot:TRINITY_DN10618_c0_g2_i3.p1 TRINITY_DN10618_c0_g2~~TRINITY_DN10618_c0_g2_i3.p1  ORF type:complete len:683 (+),score=150.87 TRINITY_DN10618_c0_g2_i3:421-2469(+)
MKNEDFSQQNYNSFLTSAAPIRTAFSKGRNVKIESGSSPPQPSYFEPNYSPNVMTGYFNGDQAQPSMFQDSSFGFNQQDARMSFDRPNDSARPSANKMTLNLNQLDRSASALDLRSSTNMDSSFGGSDLNFASNGGFSSFMRSSGSASSNFSSAGKTTSPRPTLLNSPTNANNTSSNVNLNVMNQVNGFGVNSTTLGFATQTMQNAGSVRAGSVPSLNSPNSGQSGSNPYSPVSSPRGSYQNQNSPLSSPGPYSPMSGYSSPSLSPRGSGSGRPLPVNAVTDCLSATSSALFASYGGSSAGSLPNNSSSTSVKRGRVYVDKSSSSGYNPVLSHSDSALSSVRDEGTEIAPEIVKKKKGNPQRLKKTPNSFMLFAQDYRKKCKQEHPQLSNSTISIILGRKWKNLDPAEKEYYVQKAAKMKEEFELQHPDFSYGSSGKKLRRRRAKRSNSEPPRPVLTQWEQERHFRNMVTPQLTPNNAKFTKEQLQQEFSSLQEFLTADGHHIPNLRLGSPSSSPLTSPSDSPRSNSMDQQDVYSRNNSMDIGSPSSPRVLSSSAIDFGIDTKVGILSNNNNQHLAPPSNDFVMKNNGQDTELTSMNPNDYADSKMGALNQASNGRGAEGAFGMFGGQQQGESFGAPHVFDYGAGFGDDTQELYSDFMHLDSATPRNDFPPTELYKWFSDTT